MDPFGISRLEEPALDPTVFVRRASGPRSQWVGTTDGVVTGISRAAGRPNRAPPTLGRQRASTTVNAAAISMRSDTFRLVKSLLKDVVGYDRPVRFVCSPGVPTEDPASFDLILFGGWDPYSALRGNASAPRHQQM